MRATKSSAIEIICVDLFIFMLLFISKTVVSAALILPKIIDRLQNVKPEMTDINKCLIFE